MAGGGQGAVGVARQRQQEPVVTERRGAARRIGFPVDDPLVPPRAFVDALPRRPVQVHASRETSQKRWVSLRLGPLQRPPDVVVVGRDPAAIEHIVVRLGPCDLETRSMVAGSCRVGVPGIDQLRGAEGAYRFEQREPVRSLLGDHQRLVDKLHDEFGDVVAFEGGTGAHHLRGGDREAAGEHRQTVQYCALVVVQERVAPVDRRLERLLASHGRAGAAAEEAEPILKPVAHLARAQDPEARRGQLDGEWHPVQPTADLDDRSDVRFVERELRAGAPRALDEQLDGFESRHRLEIGWSVFAGHAQRRDPERHLSLDAERLTARRHHHQRRAATQECRRQGGALSDEVLAVVEENQNTVFVDRAGEGVGDRRSEMDQPDRLRDGGADLVGVPDGSQIDEPDAPGMSVETLGCHLEGEPRLAATPGASEGERPRPIQFVADALDLVEPSHHRREAHGQVGSRGVEGSERGVVLGEHRMAELPEMFGPRHVPQRVRPQVEQGCIVGEGIAGHVGHRVGHQDLARVGRVAEPDREVNGRPLVAPILAEPHLADVHADAQPRSARARGELQRERATERVGRPDERGNEAVPVARPGGAHPVISSDRRRDDSIASGDTLLHLASVRLTGVTDGRALEPSQQEGHGSCRPRNAGVHRTRLVRHHRSLAPPRPTASSEGHDRRLRTTQAARRDRRQRGNPPFSSAAILGAVSPP